MAKEIELFRLYPVTQQVAPTQPLRRSSVAQLPTVECSMGNGLHPRSDGLFFSFFPALCAPAFPESAAGRDLTVLNQTRRPLMSFVVNLVAQKQRHGGHHALSTSCLYLGMVEH